MQISWGPFPEPPGYSAVRAMMNILVRKGSLAYKKEGRKYLYFPVISPEKARRSVVTDLVRIYFGGSVQQAISGLLDADNIKLTESDHRKLVELIQKARRKESGK